MASMTKTYLVTGEGCRRREETFVVPKGVQIIFYQTRPRPLRLSAVQTPIDELKIAVKLLPARAASPGETIQSAFCWERGRDMPPSGVFRRGTGAQVMDLSDTSAVRPVALGHVVRELAARREGRSTVIHWLVHAADAAPARHHWQLQHPPRLFNGDAGESGHAPLDELAGMQVSEIPWSEEMDDAAPPGWVTV
jgi:hypothetical protein